MTARRPALSSEARAVQLVITFLGVTLIILVLGTIYLVHEVIGKADHGKVTPASVSVLVAVVGLAGTALGSLGTMLASTSGKSSPAAGDPTTLVAPADATLKVEPAAPVEDPPDDPAPSRRRPAKKTARRRVR